MHASLPVQGVIFHLLYRLAPARSRLMRPHWGWCCRQVSSSSSSCLSSPRRLMWPCCQQCAIVPAASMSVGWRSFKRACLPFSFSQIWIKAMVIWGAKIICVQPLSLSQYSKHYQNYKILNIQQIILVQPLLFVLPLFAKLCPRPLPQINGSTQKVGLFLSKFLFLSTKSLCEDWRRNMELQMTPPPPPYSLKAWIWERVPKPISNLSVT